MGGGLLKFSGGNNTHHTAGGTEEPTVICIALGFFQMAFLLIARDHMGMFLISTEPWICISTTKKACERSLVADDEKKNRRVLGEFIVILTETRRAR